MAAERSVHESLDPYELQLPLPIICVIALVISLYTVVMIPRNPEPSTGLLGTSALVDAADVMPPKLPTPRTGIGRFGEFTCTCA